MQLPFTPDTPARFVSLMKQIWGGDCKPAEDGGVICYQSPEYNEWYDAVKVAEELGLRRTGGGKRHEKDGLVFRFPNDEGIWVSNDGSTIDPKCNRFRKRKP